MHQSKTQMAHGKRIINRNVEKLCKPDSTQDEKNIQVINHESEDIQLVTFTEVGNEINYNLSSRKALGIDLVAVEILNELPHQGILSSYSYQCCNLHKACASFFNKNLKSCKPTSLFPITFKFFEKFYLKRLKIVIEKRHQILNHQFGFRHKHSIIE